MNVLFISLGCDKNRVDSEFMLGKLAQNQFSVTDDESEADVIVINTCCFIGDAKEESIETILGMAEYRTKGRCRALIVCGCLSERYREEIRREIPEVDAVLGTNATESVLDAVERSLAGEKYECFEPLDRIEEHTAGRMISTGGHYAYLKIAEGCAKQCSYCIIPRIRGRYRSLPMDKLIAEAEQLAAQGVKELILVAQETTCYGVDLYGEKALHRLLRRFNEIDGLLWIRLLYCYPEEIYPELIAAVRDCEKVCDYIDMPIQHCNNEILKRMGRQTDKESLAATIALLRKEIPDIALRTTVICGFPGETKEQHAELLRFIEETRFDRLGSFVYSAEEDTPAASFPDQVDEETKAARQAEVMELQHEIVLAENEEMVSRRLPVLIEGKVADEDVYIGRTYRDAPDVDGYVFVETTRELISGDVLEVEITAAYEYDLIAVPVGER